MVLLVLLLTFAIVRIVAWGRVVVVVVGGGDDDYDFDWDIVIVVVSQCWRVARLTVTTTKLYTLITCLYLSEEQEKVEEQHKLHLLKES